MLPSGIAEKVKELIEIDKCLDPSRRGNISHRNIVERMTHKQLLDEYSLIIQRKSNLSSVQRKEIVRYIERTKH